MFPLCGWDLSFKATGFLQKGSLLLNINFKHQNLKFYRVSQLPCKLKTYCESFHLEHVKGPYHGHKKLLRVLEFEAEKL